MIRLYLDQDFSEGQKLSLPADEIKYFKSVRRAQGDVCLFNSRGQEGLGEIQNNIFVIQRVRKIESPAYELTVAIGLPENSRIPDLIRSLSELGVENLLFFGGDRSQSSAKRLYLNERWQKIAIESARQCGRARPLKLQIGDWENLDLSSFEAQWFFDEAENSEKLNHSAELKENARNLRFQNAIVIVGSEGGWTERERGVAIKKKFEFVHFDTPILKVTTAAICAAFFALQRLKTQKAAHQNSSAST